MSDYTPEDAVKELRDNDIFVEITDDRPDGPLFLYGGKGPLINDDYFEWCYIDFCYNAWWSISYREQKLIVHDSLKLTVKHIISVLNRRA